MASDKLRSFEYIWTTEFHEHFLLRQESIRGEEVFLIYHKPTRTLLIIEDDEADQAVISKMIAMGIPIYDDERDIPD